MPSSCRSNTPRQSRPNSANTRIIIIYMKQISALALVCALLCTACHNHTNPAREEHAHEASSHEHEHAHEHEKFLLASYSDELEIFLAAEPLSASSHSEIIAHVTRLSDFKPLDAARITVSSKLCGNCSGELSEGEFAFCMEASRAGQDSLTITVEGFRPLSIPITVYADHHEADQAAERAQVSSSNGVAFTKEQSWKLDFRTDESRLETIGQTIKASGRLSPVQGAGTSVIARSAGAALLSEGALLPGRSVSEGQTLMYISSKGFALSNLGVRLQEAQAEFERAESEWKRKSSLPESVVSKAELSSAKAAYETARANYENLAANISGDAQKVLSPQSGYIESVYVANGDFVQEGQLLATVCNDSHLMLELLVQPRYGRSLQSVVDANISYEGKTYSLAELGGRIISVARSATAASPLLSVCLEIRNNGSFVSGSFADATLLTSGGKEAVCVPQSALIEEMGAWFVYRQLTPIFFEKTQVKVGRTDGLRAEILEGLDAGQRVVSRGAALVRLAQSAGGLDPHAGHAH